MLAVIGRISAQAAARLSDPLDVTGEAAVAGAGLLLMAVAWMLSRGTPDVHAARS